MNLKEELKGLGGKKKIKLLYSCGVVLALVCAIVMIISGFVLIVTGVMVGEGVLVGEGILFILLSVPLCLFDILLWNVSCALNYDVRLIREKLVNNEETVTQIGNENKM